MSKRFRCIHRHSIETHPNCFRRGRVELVDENGVVHRTGFRDDAEFERETGIPWYDYRDSKDKPRFRIGFFDIETDNLKADFGTVLSWAIKEYNGKTIYSVIKQKELMNGTFDKRVVEEFLEAIKDYDILVGYYSTRFDLPYMRAKALHYDLDFPGLVLKKNVNGKFYVRPEKLHWDLYYTVRRNLAISRKSLAKACAYLGIPAKATPLTGEVWNRAKYGDPKALKKVLSHNIEDVESTEALWKKLQKFKHWIRTGT